MYPWIWKKWWEWGMIACVSFWGLKFLKGQATMSTSEVRTLARLNWGIANRSEIWGRSRELQMLFINIYMLFIYVMYEKSASVNCSVVSDSFETSTDYSLPGSLVRGILQARILEWVAIPFCRGSSQPREQTWVSCIAGGFLTTVPPGKLFDVCACMCAKLLQSCLTLWLHGLWPTRFLGLWDSTGKNTGVGCYALFQGIFLTQGLNLHLLHWQVGSLPLVQPGTPIWCMYVCVCIHTHTQKRLGLVFHRNFGLPLDLLFWIIYCRGIVYPPAA